MTMTEPWPNVTLALVAANASASSVSAEPSEQESLNVLVPVTVAYAIIFVAGVVGNVSTCVVIARNRYMHTATNYYLFSLAVSDLLLLVSGMPTDAHRVWYPDTYPLDHVACITLGLIAETSVNATVLTITAFTVERYIAICHPFISHTMSKLSRVVRFIVLIWVVAVCSAVPQVWHFGVTTKVNERGREVTLCTINTPDAYNEFIISSFAFFVGPMTIITVLYALIGIKLRTSRVLHPPKKLSIESNGRGGGGGSTRYRNGASQRRVIRMLVAVTLSFFVCWAPFHAQRLMAVYASHFKRHTKLFEQVYTVVTYLSGVLYFLSTAINPFLYSIMSNKFREAFRLTLAAWCDARPPTGLTRTYSALATQRPTRVSQPSPAAAAAAAGAAGASSRPGRLRRQSTASTGLTTTINGSNKDRQDNSLLNQGRKRVLSAVNESPSGSSGAAGGWSVARRLRLVLAGGGGGGARAADSAESARSISNSSLRDVEEDEYTGEELATYMQQVNHHIDGSRVCVI